MPEFRADPFKRLVVISAPKRAKRPTVAQGAPVCPFDRGNEKLTPPARYAQPNAEAWVVRAFENKFPFLSPARAFKPSLRGPAFGVHEVIVETDRHAALFQDFSDAQLLAVFGAYRDRFETIARTPGVASVLLFRNHGPKSGASIAHEHAQIAGLPFAPELVAREEASFRDAFAETRDCALCGVVAQKPENVFYAAGGFVAFCPSFGRFGGEAWVVPREHASSFVRFGRREALSFMRALRETTRAVSDGGKLDYTVAFHAFPDDAALHFHAELYPRKADWGGLEMGAGVVVNSRDPAEAARAYAGLLRKRAVRGA